MGLEQLLKIEIAELSSTNKQKLLDNLQEKYSICIQNGWFKEFKVLQGITGIKPDENVVQKGYVFRERVMRPVRVRLSKNN